MSEDGFNTAVELLQICRNVLDDRLSVDAGFGLIQTMNKSDPSVASILVDVLSLLDAEIVATKAKGDLQKRFVELISQLSNKVVLEEVLRVELSVMGANDSTMRSRIVKTKTKLFFKQLKFNLFREESEGYAKLLTELLSLTSLNAQVIVTRIHRLIGQFNLDPNRTLDIILECFEAEPNRRQFFLALLTELKASSDDLCNILGFKFTFYQKNNDTPRSLYRLAAIMCHEKYIDLLSLCSFLTPKLNELIIDHKERLSRDSKRARKAETICTGALPVEPRSNGSYADDSSAPIAGVSFASVYAVQDAEDEKLEAGCDVSHFLFLFLNTVLENILTKNQKLGLTYALLEEGAWPSAKQLLDRFPEFYAVSASRDIALAIADMLERSIDDFYQEKCKVALEPTSLPPSFADAHSLEIVGSWSELISVVLPVLTYLGPYVAYRPNAATKLVRLLTVYFEEKEKSVDSAHHIYLSTISNTLVDIIDEVLLPSLSLTTFDYTFSEELWNLISHFPYMLRYRMYSRWKTVHTLRHSKINIRKAKTYGMVRYVVKRLSKESVRIMGRQLGKLCHAHPGVVFDYLLNQIQTFENLIEPVVESIRFLSNLEFDVLSFCIIEHLASPEKQQLKSSDGTLSPWLQSLATFIGTVFLKYNMELTGVLQYVANQLKNGKSFDLLVLREIIQNMSGIESTTNLTADQLEALAGGDTLRQEAGSFSLIRANRRATTRLREALFKEHLIVGLSILTAQQRQCIVFVESNDIPLKLAGQMLDKCQETLVQFGSFLRSNIRNEEYLNRMPSLCELISRFHLTTDAAFFLSRPTFMPRIYSLFDKARKALRDPDGSKVKLDGTQKFELFKKCFDEVFGELEKTAVPLLPEVAWTDISPKVFMIFWGLTLYDIYIPKGGYENEMVKVRKSISALQENVDLSKTRRAKEEEQLKGTEKKLGEELKRQTEHVERILNILRIDKERFFAECHPKLRGMQMAHFLQHCILPRAVFTDVDAAYCAKFVHLMHVQRTGFFQTVFFFDKLFTDLAVVLAAFSENEANCFGRFLAMMLELVQRWHSEKSIYEKECQRYPGFITKVQMPGETTANSSDGMDFESYRTLCHKWQARMTRSFLGILTGSNYVLMRNCLMVMIKVLQYFPLIDSHVSNLEKCVSMVRDKEKGVRDDLSLMAASYLGHLRMRKTKTFADHEFYNRVVDPKKTARTKAADSRKTVARVETSTLEVKKGGNKGSDSSVTKKIVSSTASGSNKVDHLSSDSNTSKDTHKIATSNEERKRGAEPADTPSKKKNKTLDAESSEKDAKKEVIKEELVQEDGEVTSSSPPSSTHLSYQHETTPPAKKSRSRNDDDTGKREVPKTRHDDRKEEKERKKSGGINRNKSDDYGKPRERSWKRPGDSSLQESESSQKILRKDNGSSERERTPDSRVSRVSDPGNSSRSSSKHRRSREPQRKDNGRDRDR
uniref:THO complex subunit 2 n=1 Tax=Syphacia muris TaxID=451379 RepID=A0A158R5S7_9BILA